MAIRPLTKKDLETITLYESLMEEVKIRIETINLASTGRLPIPSPVVYEFCFLQLRLICEDIGLACLVAHGDIEAANTKKLKETYEPGKILKQLGELHPDFYPFPSKITQHASGANIELLKDGDFLRKEELKKLWDRSGDYLHKGNLKKLLSPDTPTQHHFPVVMDWAWKVQRLLDAHTIARLSGNPLVCLLSDVNKNGRVSAFILSPGLKEK